MFRMVLSIALGLQGLASFMPAATAAPPKPPMTRTIDHVDDYHGTKVADPYRWLEDDVRDVRAKSPPGSRQRTRSTFGFLETIPQREAIQERLTELWNYEKFSAPFKAGGRYYFLKNDGLQNQSVLYVQDTLDGEPRVLIDPNTWSKDGTVALGGHGLQRRRQATSPTASRTAARTGAIWKVMEIDTGKVLADELKWVKFNGARLDGRRQGLLLQPLRRAERGRRSSRA